MENITFRLEYLDQVKDVDIPKLSFEIRQRIQMRILQRLLHNPLLYSKPLMYSLQNYRTLRVQNYRVVFRIVSQIKVVRIVMIEHRSSVYKSVVSRIKKQTSDI